MAGQYLTLGEIKLAAVYRGDLEGLSDRHPSFNVNFEVNASWRMLRTMMANNDVVPVLTQTALLTLPVTAQLAGLGGWAEIPWPADAVSIHGLDVVVGGSWSKVNKGMLEQRRMYPYNSDRADYRYAQDAEAIWIEKSLPQGSASPGTIMLFPVPSAGQYILWYLSQWVDITTDTSEFPGQEAWLQWVIWDVAIKALIRDIGVTNEAQLQEAKNERDRIWATVKPNMMRTASDGPIQVQSRYGGRSGYRMVP
jgi:hypothetical protein